jgi:hypothetical protein
MTCGWQRRESAIGGHYYQNDNGRTRQAYHNNRCVPCPGGGWRGWIYGVGDIDGLYGTHHEAVQAVERAMEAGHRLTPGRR